MSRGLILYGKWRLTMATCAMVIVLKMLSGLRVHPDLKLSIHLWFEAYGALLEAAISDLQAQQAKEDWRRR